MSEELGKAVPVLRKGIAPQDSYPGGELHWLASRKASGAEELTLGYTVIQVGARNPLHRHPNCEEVLYVLSGEVRHYIEGTEDVNLRPGDCITVPRNRIHQAVNIGETPVELIVAFSSAERETVFVD